MVYSVKMNIQVGAIKAIAAVGAGDLAISFFHFTTAQIANIDLFLLVILVGFMGVVHSGLV